jgi:hypothetical protein
MTAKTFDTIKAAREFVLAGNALVTLQSKKTGAHYTYQVNRVEGEKFTGGPAWFVKLLTEGSADEGQWTYIGMIFGTRFTTTKASERMRGAPCVSAFTYFMNARDLEQLIVRHEGRCGRCGRTLTEPESIDSGFGPICRAAMWEPK